MAWVFTGLLCSDCKPNPERRVMFSFKNGEKTALENLATNGVMPGRATKICLKIKENTFSNFFFIILCLGLS
jgi:hypothetical protein